MKKSKQICSILVVIIILNMAFMPVINANEVALPAAASENMYGDANEDGLINMQDVTKVERIILEYDEPTETADANEDGMINMLDVTNIDLIILGRLPHPGEELIHFHIRESHSTIIAAASPVFAGALVAVILKHPYLAAGAVTLGFILSVYSYASFKDETGCIWVWYPKDSEDYNYHFTPTPYSAFTFLPDFLRISSITTWDYMDIGDP